MNAATIMREGVLFQKKEDEELKKYEHLHLYLHVNELRPCINTPSSEKFLSHPLIPFSHFTDSQNMKREGEMQQNS